MIKDDRDEVEKPTFPGRDSVNVNANQIGFDPSLLKVNSWLRSEVELLLKFGLRC